MAVLIYFIYFCIFSFVGWIIEMVFRSIKEEHFVNSGCLFGPFIPIYGYTATTILLFDNYFIALPLIFRIILFCLLPSVFEYAGSYLLEKKFSVQLWDYSHLKLNLHGRICLSFSSIWAVLIIFLYFAIQPFLYTFILTIQPRQLLIASFVLFIYFSIDTIVTIKAFNKVKIIISMVKQKAASSDLQCAKYDGYKFLKSLIRPIHAFPAISKIILKNLYLNNFNSDKLIQQAEKDIEYTSYTFDIKNNLIFMKLKNFHHHLNSIYIHSIKVSYLSYKIGKVLNHYFTVRLMDLARGSLLHDFFLYDWRTERLPMGKQHAFEHPKEAYRNSLKYITNITEIEKDIILKHMWPLSLRSPKYLETLIVILVDKLIASDELFIEFVSKKSKGSSLILSLL